MSVLEFGIEKTEEPVQAARERGHRRRGARFIPLRTCEVLLGFMFIVDPEETLVQRSRQAEEAAAAAAHVLYRERRLRELEASASGGCSRTCRRRLRRRRARRPGARRRGVPGRRARRGAGDPGGHRPARCEIAVGSALDRLRRERTRSAAGWSCVKADHGVFVVALDDASGGLATRPRRGPLMASSPTRPCFAETTVAVDPSRHHRGQGALEMGRGGSLQAGARRRRHRPVSVRRASAASPRRDHLGVLRTLARGPGQPRRRRASIRGWSTAAQRRHRASWYPVSG